MLVRIMKQIQSPVSHRSLFNPLLFMNVSRLFSQSPYEQSITNILLSASALGTPTKVIVEDRSGGCGANFYIMVESNIFRGLPRLRQHRLVQEVLKDEIAKWHAVSIETRVSN